MSFQLISTYTIVFFASGYTLYQFVCLFMKQKSSCGGSCGGCSFKNELKKRGISGNPILKNQNFTYIKN